MCKIDVATEGCIYRCGQRVNKRDTRLGLWLELGVGLKVSCGH